MADKLTRRACVIGWPAAHSRSPLIHNYWIKLYGIAGEYKAEAVPPDQFAAFARDLARHGYVGANVTIPHKEMALAISEADARAQAVGAANTLWLADGRLKSTNTDIEGFLTNLDDAIPGWDTRCRKAVVLGAGGAARAVVHGLIERGVAEVHVVNRTAERAQALQARFGKRVHPAQWTQAQALLPETDLLVNSTSLGMHGQPPLAFDIGLLPGHAVVTDLVYVPLETALLKTARARGLRTADGLGMLLRQAVGGFALWFGVRPDVTAELRALVEADITKS